MLSKFFFALLFVCSNAHANLITNGGFETGNFSGWTQSGNLTNTAISTTVNTGKFSGSFAPVATFGTITQNVTTTAGMLYDLTYWLSNGSSNANGFNVTANGSALFTLNNSASFGFQKYKQTFTATAASTAISFNFLNTNLAATKVWYLDDVSMVLRAGQNNVPVPATLALLVVGLAGMGWSRHRKA